MPELTENQLKNYAFFKEHLDEYLADPLKKGKYAVILDESLINLFDSFENAYRFACSTGSREFIVQWIIDRSKTVGFYAESSEPEEVEPNALDLQMLDEYRFQFGKDFHKALPCTLPINNRRTSDGVLMLPNEDDDDACWPEYDGV
jgi:hypothetical protein